ECRKRTYISNILQNTIELFGFEQIITPTFEFFEVFSAERGTVAASDMYKFFDRDGNTLVLRPDITPAVARCIAKYYRDETQPVRLFYNGNTFKNGLELRGDLKETTQIGAELINDPSVEGDAEMIALTCECLKNTGLKDFRVEIGDAGFFKALAEEAGLTADEIESLRASVIDKNTFGMEDILENKSISNETKQALYKLPELFGNMQSLPDVKKITSNAKAQKALDRLEELFELLKVYGCEEYITFDLGALSKYEYYTGITFSAFTYGTGNPVLTGGRYDSLVSQFGKDAPAIGLAFLLDELMAALSRQKLLPELKNETEVVEYGDSYEEAVKKATEFRKSGIKCKLVKKNI
ncbi:MAG: ATP phosphoribosyltransferase regulatory subunit, partial [Lachnospiraceae bacterium]|nr:ATP phosphoribosyltransferase regulatory subunit [Lachnospiraceae bacterium]